MDTPRIDEIARRLLESVPPAVRTLQKDLESNFRAVLRASLTKLDLSPGMNSTHRCGS